MSTQLLQILKTENRLFGSWKLLNGLFLHKPFEFTRQSTALARIFRDNYTILPVINTKRVVYSLLYEILKSLDVFIASNISTIDFQSRLHKLMLDSIDSLKSLDIENYNICSFIMIVCTRSFCDTMSDLNWKSFMITTGLNDILNSIHSQIQWT